MTDISHCYVMSIQSHVVFGYVGNKVASFALQTAGFPTDTIDTVRFSNHSHYKYRSGDLMKYGEITNLLRALKMNNLDSRYTHLLSGFTYTESIMYEIVQAAIGLRECNPALFYLCDPVLGDNNKLYVNEALIDSYREKVLKVADAITPNQYEAETLSRLQITNQADVFPCLNKLHELGPPLVIITSVSLPDCPEELIAFASQRRTVGPGQTEFEQYQIRFPKINVHFSGTGDLFASCFLAWWTKLKSLKEAFENTIATVQNTLKVTYDHALKLPGALELDANVELRLVDCAEFIRNPQVEYHAQLIKQDQ